MGDVEDRTLIEDAVRQLVPMSVRPWTIEASRYEATGCWCVQLHHEASNGLAFEMGRQDAGETIDALAGVLSPDHPELQRIAAAPALVNQDDVMEIRALAHHFNWSRLEVRSVVRYVEGRLLNHEEAEWLVAWVGRDGPPPSPSRDF